jgi:hypothetical protein
MYGHKWTSVGKSAARSAEIAALSMGGCLWGAFMKSRTPIEQIGTTLI